jgi:PAS domain S-box-containing protein
LTPCAAIRIPIRVRALLQPGVDVAESSGAALSGGLCDAQTLFLDDIAKGIPLRTTLEHLILGIEVLAQGLKGSVLLAEGGRLRFGAAPNLPDAYNSAVDGVVIGEGFGSCGTAAHRGQLVIVEDVSSDPLWKNYRDIARRHRLAACWSMPLFGRSGELLGTFALYYDEPRRPTSAELNVVQGFARLAGIAIEQSRQDQKLREAERGLRDLVEDLDVIVWEADAETHQFTYVSRRAEKMLGYPLERWYKEPGFWDRLIHPDDRDATVRRAREAATAGTEYESEYRVVAADGRIVWIRNLVSPKTSAGGTPLLRGVLANISRQREADAEREHALARLVEERILLRSVLDQLPQGVVVVEPASSRVLIANRQAQELFGSTVRIGAAPDESSALANLRSNGEPYAFSEGPMMRAIREGATAIEAQVELPQPEGQAAHLAVNASAVRNCEGRIIAGAVVFADITERRRVEAATRLVAEVCSIVGSTLDPDETLRELGAIATRKFADWCAVFLHDGEQRVRCAAFCHRESAKTARKPDLDRLLPQPGGVPLRLSAVLSTGQSELLAHVVSEDVGPGAVRSELLRLLRELGTESAITVALRRAARTLGAIVFASARPDHPYTPADVTVAEELARRTTLAVENGQLYRDAQKAILQLAVAAHELRSPLSALQLNIQAMRVQLARPDLSKESLMSRLVAGEAQSHRLAKLIDDLLDVSLIWTSQLRLVPRLLDLVEAVHRVVQRFRDELVAKGVEVAVHAPSPVLGCWDPFRIEQVITNLVSNGIKYGEGKAVVVAVEASGGTAILRVEDHGAGMSPELKRRLFQPFERGVPAGRARGLGLGLYIAAQLVEAHHGRISVQSAPGVGSTFVVELPREAAA